VKPRPVDDYSVSARAYAFEFEDAIAPLLHDCFWLMLNATVTVSFVPEFDPTTLRLFDVDVPPADEGEARSEVVYRSQYVVTSSDARDGEVQRIVGSGATEGLDAAVFFVSRSRFAAFLDDLRAIAEVTGGAIPSRVRMSTFASLSVIDFVKRVFSASPELSESHRVLLAPPA